MEPFRPMTAASIAIKLELTEDTDEKGTSGRQPSQQHREQQCPQPRHQQRSGPAPHVAALSRWPSSSSTPALPYPPPGRCTTSAPPPPFMMAATSATLLRSVPLVASSPILFRRDPVPVLPRPPDMPHCKPQLTDFRSTSFVPVYCLLAGTPSAAPSHSSSAATHLLLQPAAISTAGPGMACLSLAPAPLPSTTPPVAVPLRPLPDTSGSTAPTVPVGRQGGKKRGSSVGSSGSSESQGRDRTKKARRTAASHASAVLAPRQSTTSGTRAEQEAATLLGPLLSAAVTIAAEGSPASARAQPGPACDVATATLARSHSPFRPVGNIAPALHEAASKPADVRTTRSRSSDQKLPASSSSSVARPLQAADEDEDVEAAVSTLGSLKILLQSTEEIIERPGGEGRKRR